MKQVNSKTSNNFLYFLLGLVLFRPALDILSQYNFQITDYLPSININVFIGIIVFISTFIYLLRNLGQTLKTPLFYSISVFLGLIGLSIFYSPNLTNSLQEFIRLATIWLLYLITFQIIQGKKEFWLLVKVILASYILPALFALWQLVFRLGLSDDFGGFLRIYGTFAHPNPFAFYSILILGLVIALALSKQLKIFSNQEQEKPILWVLAILIAFLILVTYTRSALACLFIFILIFGLFKYRSLLIVGAIIIACAYLFLPSFQERLIDLVSLDPSGSVVWRLRLWKDMLPMVLWHPWLGFGLNSFESINEFYRGYALGSLEAHNDYLKILFENGIAGLAAYGLIVLGVFVNLTKIMQKVKIEYKNLALGILIIFLAIFSASFFDNVLRATALQWNLWILLGAWFKINSVKK